MTATSKGAPRKALPRNGFTWLRAVTMFDELSGKSKVLRLANALFLSADNDTGLTWASNENLAILAGLPDRSNFRKARLMLEGVGAMESGAIVDLSVEIRPKSFDPRGTYFRLNFDWAENVVNLTTSPILAESDMVKPTTECGQTDHEAWSNQPQSVVSLTPLSLISPDISQDLQRERAREMDIDDLILEAIETKDETLLRLVELRKLRPKLRDLIGEEDYERWLARSLSWEEIVGGIDGKTSPRKSA